MPAQPTLKLRRIPEDFLVEELSDFAPAAAGSGEYALYRLTKCNLGTPEAVDAVLRRWRLERRQVAYGGLKDRHAITRQMVTIRRGPRRDLNQTNLELEYLGQAERPFGPHDISGNRFEVVVRALSPLQAAAAARVLPDVDRDGLPNYFDDQRFRSVGESGRFVARAWISGDYEEALRLALVEPNPLDRPRERREKELVRARWGDWRACQEGLGRSHRRSLVTYLCDRPGDFRGALSRLRADYRSIYLSAFQSHLWNRLLAAFLAANCRPGQLVPVRLRMGPVPFFIEPDDETRSTLHAAQFPLPSSRLKLDEGPVKDLLERTLAGEGLALADIRIRPPPHSFFSKGWRAAAFTVRGLSSKDAADDLYHGSRKLTLRFELGRGSYATMLMKRIALALPPRG